MRKILVVLALCVIASVPGRAQIPVTDVAAIVQLVNIVRNVRATILLMQEELQTLQRIARGYGGSLEPYRLPGLPGLDHDESKADYGRLLLNALNTGDPRGEKYTAVVRDVMRPGGLFEALPEGARRVMTSAFAGIELSDSIATMGIHESAMARGYAERIAVLVERLQNDVIAPNFHQVTEIADKLALAEAIEARIGQNTNQTLNAMLEQQLAKNYRSRQPAAAQINMWINSVNDADRSTEAILGNSESALRNWRIR